MTIQANLNLESQKGHVWVCQSIKHTPVLSEVVTVVITVCWHNQTGRDSYCEQLLVQSYSSLHLLNLVSTSCYSTWTEVCWSLWCKRCYSILYTF